MMKERAPENFVFAFGQFFDIGVANQLAAAEAGAVISDRLWCICFMARRSSPRLNRVTWAMTQVPESRVALRLSVVETMTGRRSCWLAVFRQNP